MEGFLRIIRFASNRADTIRDAVRAGGGAGTVNGPEVP